MTKKDITHSFTWSLIHSCNNHSLRTCFLPGTAQETGDTAGEEEDEISAYMGTDAAQPEVSFVPFPHQSGITL